MTFNEIPLDNMVPLFATEFNNTRAAKGGVMPWKNLIIGQPLSANNANAGSLKRVFSDVQADQLFGAGSQIALMIRAFRKANSFAELWALAVPDATNSGGQSVAKASGKIEVDFASGSTASASGVIKLMIAGQACNVSVEAGLDDVAIAKEIAFAINANSQLPVTATQDTGESSALLPSVTITAKNAGTFGNGINIRYNHNQGEELPGNVTVTITDMDDAGADPTYSDDNVGNIIRGTWFNSVAVGSSEATNVAYIKSVLDTRWTATVQQTGVAFFGVNVPEESGDTHVAEISLEDYLERVEDLNSQVLVVPSIPKSPTPGFVMAAATMGVCAGLALNNPALPLKSVAVPGIVAPKEEDRLDLPNNNLLLKAGCALLVAADDGTVYLSRIVTTYKHNAMGENDVSYQQLETVFTLARLRWDWNNDMSNKYPRAVIGSDDDQYGPGVPVITPTTGKAEIISKYEDWVKAGFCKNLALFRDNVVCIQDPDDEHALQWYVPADLVKQFFIGKTQFAFS